MKNLIPWAWIIVGVLWLLPLLNVNLGAWTNWVVAILVILVGVAMLKNK